MPAKRECKGNGFVVGKLLYGNGDMYLEFPDRSLAHLQLAISTKIRRDEAFFLSWRDELANGGGRGSLWISPAVPLRFVYTRTTQEPLNRRWLAALTASANTPQGLFVSEEPADEEPAQNQRMSA